VGSVDAPDRGNAPVVGNLKENCSIEFVEL